MSFIAHTIKTGKKAKSFAVGLRWTVLKNGGATESKRSSKIAGLIREEASTLSATKYVVTKLGNARFLGLYTDPIDADEKSEIYSLATLLLCEITRRMEDVSKTSMMFLLEPPHLTNKRVLIVIEDGQITSDVLLDKERAIAETVERKESNPAIVLFSQYKESTAATETMSWSDIEAMATKDAEAALLLSIPIPGYLIPAIGILAIAVASAAAYYYLVSVPEQKREAARQLAKQDKTLEYLEASNLELSNTGWKHADLADFVARWSDYSIFNKGWALQSVTCDTKVCTTKWVRKAGLVPDLVAILPNEKIDVENSSVDTNYMNSEHKTSFADLKRDSLKNLSETKQQLRPIFQMMINAGINAESGTSAKWAGFPSTGVSPNVILEQMPVSVSLPLHKAGEVISVLPESVLIKSFSIMVSDDASHFDMSLKGVVYVRQ